MAIESRVADSGSAELRAEILARAEGHLRLLRAYFGFQAYGSLVVVGLILLSPVVGHPFTTHGNPWLTVPTFALSAWAGLRTRHLLLKRSPEGVWMAAATFGCNLLAAASAGQLDTGAFFSGLGILLAANVYRHLRWLRI